ncbi:nuclear transport factor 2 family protein [Streptomyces sp. NPDC056486]|uniref:nuclear transport factor 2 family protein n=1 Tax=Streptomyces sp. NPDC056486 TaxID=3345835 RepID=UPI0036C14512
MTNTAHATTAPEWALKFMDAIDTLEFGEGFAPLTEDTDMFFGTEHIHGVEAIKAFFVKIDEPLIIKHEILEFWAAGDGVRLLRGEATMAKKTEPDRVVRAPFTHIFYLADEELTGDELTGEETVRIRELRITAGPLQTDAVM